MATYKFELYGDDWADLYQVTLDSITYEPTFEPVASRNFKCSTTNTGGDRYCDFNAGAGVYVDSSGRLTLYGVEHYNDAYPDTDYGVKVREFPE